MTSPGDISVIGRPFRYESRRSPGFITWDNGLHKWWDYVCLCESVLLIWKGRVIIYTDSETFDEWRRERLLKKIIMSILGYYRTAGHVKAKYRCGRKGKLSIGCFNFIHQQLEQNSELTVKALRDKPFYHFGLNVERSTVQRARKNQDPYSTAQGTAKQSAKLTKQSVWNCSEMLKK